MIGFLAGTLADKQPPFLIVDVQGVGYEVEAPMSSFYQLGEVGSQVKLLIHTHVREDALLLFGFVSQDEKRLFRELIKVSGIGAKTALAILSSLSVADFTSCIEHENITGLTKVPGIGKKSAEKLIIEMRDRLKKLVFSSVTVTSATASSAAPKLGLAIPAVEALVSLGYKEPKAEKMVKAVYQEDMQLEEIIKQALRQA